jgi:hypothetical protein
MQHDNDVTKMISKFSKDHAPLFKFIPYCPLVYLCYFEIYDNNNKNQGLGKQLFLYVLIQMRKRYPHSIYFWNAKPLDGKSKKEDLFRFYKNCGGIVFKEYSDSALFYINLAKLDLGIFKPQKEISNFFAVRSKL